MSFNIAIDGPAGAGKSTIARKIAAELSYIYVDTGAMYRAMALYFLRLGLDGEDREGMAAACGGADISIRYVNGEQQVFLNGENVTPYIRSEEVGNMASKSSPVPQVREKLTQLQKELAAREDVVMDGRDIGTCVLPRAQVKIYLTASTHTRALRRFKELEEKGIRESLEKIEADIADRDYRDIHRDISPLRQAEDAWYLDTSDIGIDEVVEAILDRVEQSRDK